MERTRRRFLAGSAFAAVASAGCLGLEGGDGDGGGDGGPAPTSAIDEEPRLDEPPYEIEAQPDDPEAWNKLYLCENMPSGTDMSLRTVSAPRLTDPRLPSAEPKGDEYTVRVLTSEADVHEVFETGQSTETGETEDPGSPVEEETTDDGGSGSEKTDESGTPGGEGTDGSGGSDDEMTPVQDETTEGPIEATDFEEYVLLVVESGYVSGSMTHHWERVERTERGFRLHGCYAVPYERTSDATPRRSVVRVGRPDEFEFARVSLTTAEDERVHFNSTEGIVSIQRDL